MRLRTTKTIIRIGEGIFVLGAVLAALLPLSPWWQTHVLRDSGVFLYTGWRILDGEVPYLDVWDHKPPLVFYVNALGLALTGSRWGVWAIEVISACAAAYLSFALCKALFGRLTASISLGLWLVTLLFVIEGGNLTTEYALPFQFALLWLARDVQPNPAPLGRWFLFGILAGVAFFLKQTTIGIAMAVVAYLILQCMRTGQGNRLLRQLGLMLLGAGVMAGAVAAFFAAQGALAEFWDAAFRYNLSYIAPSPDTGASGLAPSRLRPVISGITPLTRTGLFPLALLGYTAAAFSLFRKTPMPTQLRSLLLIGLIGLPIELLLVSASGRTYPHYYMALLPILSILTAFSLWKFLSTFNLQQVSPQLRVAYSLAILVSLGWSYFDTYWQQVRSFQAPAPQHEQAALFIQNKSTPEDYVLLWGAESGINFVAQRPSPTRYVYQYPLYQAGYVSDMHIAEFLADLEATPPRFIIDTQNQMTPIFELPTESSELQARIATLRATYGPSEMLGSWVVYAPLPETTVTSMELPSALTR